MERKLTAILAADVVGYSRLMAADEAGTHARLRTFRKELVEPATKEHHGRIVKLMGDGVLIEFASVVDAVACALTIQKETHAQESDGSEDKRIRLRIGINIGDVIIDEDDIYGDGVNVASRLETLARPGGICVSQTVVDHVKGKLDVSFAFMGPQKVKNVPEPIRAYRVGNKAETEPKRAHRRLLVASLATLGLCGIAAVVWLVVPWPWHEVQDASGIDTASKSLAVLPFDNLSTNSDEDYFADGMTDDLITDLSKVPDLLVIARNSVFALEDQAMDVREAARELGVRYVLEGSVRRAGDRVRINAQLIDGETGNHLWAERYDRDLEDIFVLQDEVVQNIVRALSLHFADGEDHVVRLPTRNLEAYDYFLRAEDLAYRAKFEDVAEALALYNEAIALDEDFADAYSGYARAVADILIYSFSDILPTAVARKHAYEAASRALELDPGQARSYSVLALLQMLDGEHSEAIASANKAVELAPHNSDALLNLAIVQSAAGEAEEALATIQAVLQLNPVPTATIRDFHASIHFDNRRFQEAYDVLIADDLNSMGELGLATLAASASRLGKPETAERALEVQLKRFPSTNLTYFEANFAHWASAELLRLRIDALREAGVPQWPHGFDGSTERRLRGADIDAITFGKTWTGELESDVTAPLMQYNAKNGDFILRTPISQLVGSLSRENDELCVVTESFLLGRKFCGHVYEFSSAGNVNEYKYAFATAYGISRFELVP